MISLNIKLSDRAKTLLTIPSVDKETKISIFKEIICSYNNILSPEYMALKFGGFPLPNNKTLSECGIENGNTLTQSKIDLDEIPGLVVSYEPDMITGEYSKEEARALMPCGHVISRESLTEYLKSLIQQRKVLIECPGIDKDNKICKKMWSFGLCKKIGVFTREEKDFFENNFSAIFLSEKLEAKACPCCNSIIMKPQDVKINRVSCSVCSKSNKGYDFCWICLKKWSLECENNLCASTEDLQEILKNCKKITIGVATNVPEYRACPKCTTLISHIKACKHMKCTKCQQEFCFVCLSLKKNNQWQCGTYSDLCEVAPIQTNLKK